LLFALRCANDKSVDEYSQIWENNMVGPTIVAPAQAGAAKPAGEQKAPKEPKAKKEKTGVSRPRLPKPEDEHVITVLKPNAKSRASGERYNVLKTGMKVKEYISIMTAAPWNRTPGEVYADLRWNTDPNRKLIHIGPTTVPVPAPAPATAPTAPKVA
jgi:hypothetical protein